MKKWKMPQLFCLLGTLGYLLRRLVYAGAVDEKNLIRTGHPLVVALWVVTAAALALAAFTGWKAEKAPLSQHASRGAFMCHGLLGIAAAMTVLMNPMPTLGLLGTLWKVLGIASAPCLLYAGFERLRGRAPFFALYAVPCLFFTVHIIANYQLWCSNPQLTDYGFDLLASVMLALHCYQLCALPVGAGSKKLLTCTALAAIYLCAAEIPQSQCPMLYFTAALFSASNLGGKGKL